MKPATTLGEYKPQGRSSPRPPRGKFGSHRLFSSPGACAGNAERMTIASPFGGSGQRRRRHFVPGDWRHARGQRQEIAWRASGGNGDKQGTNSGSRANLLVINGLGWRHRRHYYSDDDHRTKTSTFWNPLISLLFPTSQHTIRCFWLISRRMSSATWASAGGCWR